MSEKNYYATLKENLPDEATLREVPSDATIREGTPERDFPSSALIEGHSSFRGLAVLEQLPTRGAEADIYLLRDDADEKCILKLYRHRLEPKIEVLQRIREISRANSRCFVVFRDAGFDETTGRWFELLEYMPLGSLRDVSPEVRQNPEFIKALVSELDEAFHCLHENGIIHCDVKPGNILVRSMEPVDLVLTDFGIASLLAADVSQKMTSLKGTPMYWAPEAFSRMSGRPGDWWGLGMIVLELLSDGHPFAGLTDSQIIHRLTIGNADIPETLPDEWKLLLKGLLTKDDTKRWGHGEVVRWLAGERDIPVYRETRARAERPARETLPFRFEAKDYHTPRELAQMLCGREQPWAVGPQFLRYIRSWLESNMMFDEAVELANDADRLESDMALFRFVHRYAQGPFAYLGKVIDANNLKLFLARAARQEASFSEQRIVRMMGDGSLITLYGIWSELTGGRDPTLLRLLPIMREKLPAEQWRCFEILENPSAFLWPKDLNGESESESGKSAPDMWTEEETLAALATLGTLPLSRGDFETLRGRFVLPADLSAMLDSASTCSAGARWLEDMRERDLLIPRGSWADDEAYGRLTLDEYSARARVVCMGHSATFLKSLNDAIDAFDGLPSPSNELADRMILSVKTRLSLLRRVKVAPYDVLYLNRLLELLYGRRKLRSEQPTMYIVAGTAGAVTIGPLLAVTGRFGIWTVLTLTAAAFLWGGFMALRRFEPALENTTGSRPVSPGTYGNPRRAAGQVVVLPFLGVVLGIYGINNLIERLPILAWGLSGAVIACGGYYVYIRSLLNRNLERITEVCGDYCTAFGGNPDSKTGNRGGYPHV